MGKIEVINRMFGKNIKIPIKNPSENQPMIRSPTSCELR